MYIVWVGGVEIATYAGEFGEIDANRLAEFYQWQGYDDVAIEAVEL